MATLPRRIEESHTDRLYNGDRMLRDEFHRIYCEMRADYRAELIGGIVFEPSPVSYFHGTHHGLLAYLLGAYVASTRGTEMAGNATLILSEEDEVQPDLMLRISQACGGRSVITKDGYIEGAPELVAEVAYSSRAIDLHLKKERYALAGVGEYIVACLKPKGVFWFDLRGGSELQASRRGVVCSRIFPGLSIHAKGLLDLNYELTGDAIERGLKSAEHHKFVVSLADIAEQRHE